MRLTDETNRAIKLSGEDRAQLEGIARSRSLPHGLVRRAQIVLLSAAGVGPSEIGRRFKTSRAR